MEMGGADIGDSLPVILSAAKDLIAACERHEVLRFAQDDERATKEKAGDRSPALP